MEYDCNIETLVYNGRHFIETSSLLETIGIIFLRSKHHEINEKEFTDSINSFCQFVLERRDSEIQKDYTKEKNKSAEIIPFDSIKNKNNFQ